MELILILTAKHLIQLILKRELNPKQYKKVKQILNLVFRLLICCVYDDIDSD